MIPKGLFTQIGMVILSVALIITYVRPMISEIGVTQDNIKLYQEEKKRVVSVNSQLADLVSRLESTSNDDKRKLLTYMPDAIDTVAIPRDLLLISTQAGVLYKSAVSRGPVTTTVDPALGTRVPEKHLFSLSVEGTYSQIKTLFSLMEQNNYPLEVVSANVIQLDGLLLAADIELATYAYQEGTAANEIIF